MLRPFLGVDGEGCGRNRYGQQHYRLLGAGGAGYDIAPLYTGKPLSTYECLDWICELPAAPILTGFSFGYDASQILRDLPPDRVKHLFSDKPMGDGRSRYTYWEDFGVEFLPKNYLRVCRLQRRSVQGPDDRWFRAVSAIPGTARTIYETFGFFQMSFLKALEAFGIGREHWTAIEKGKAGRATFQRITREIRRYNALECELLAELMETFRSLCYANQLRPKSWNGAGKLAAAEHTSHGTITAERVRERVPPECLEFATQAYYGGRFEVFRIGEIAGPIYEYDINSAYPTALLSLPCLEHGRWRRFTGNPPPGLHVAYVSFSHPEDAQVCGLPIRQPDGKLFWPRQGQGVYWSAELASARRLGADLRYTAGWAYRSRCKCEPFAWVKHRYQQRLDIARENKARGIPLKLALNSLYGKLAQRIGNPRWSNFVWAGLVTATTRAALNDAAAADPAGMIMLATDGLFTRTPIDVPTGSDLGQWEADQHPRLFVCQPGVYWGAKRPKTRGMPHGELTRNISRFERAWALWCGTLRDRAPPPVVAINLPLFVGLRLAHARGKPRTACVWTDGEAAKREYSFDWSGKRDPIPTWETPHCVLTSPAAGASDLVSVSHQDNTAWALLNEERQQFDDQPDLLDLSPPFRT